MIFLDDEPAEFLVSVHPEVDPRLVAESGVPSAWLVVPSYRRSGLGAGGGWAAVLPLAPAVRRDRRGVPAAVAGRCWRRPARRAGRIRAEDDGGEGPGEPERRRIPNSFPARPAPCKERMKNPPRRLRGAVVSGPTVVVPWDRMNAGGGRRPRMIDGQMGRLAQACGRFCGR